jgi:hypothetical protein
MARTRTSGKDRWNLVCELLHNDALPVINRVAGLLVLPYGQLVSKICRLTDADVIDVDLGISARESRNAALMLLAVQLLAGVLEQMLGIHRLPRPPGSATQAAPRLATRPRSSTDFPQ